MSLRRLSRFAVAGAVNTVVGLGLIYAGMALGLADGVANFVGYALGISLSFFVNRRWTFDHRGPPGPAASRFAVAVMVAYLANLATLLLTRDGLELSPWLAQAAGVGPYAVVLYLLSHFWVFRPGGGPASP